MNEKASLMQRMGTRVTRIRSLLYVPGIIFLLIALVYQLDQAPPFWWDEGWTLMLARNWAELGFYGQINDGIPQSPGLAGAFPIVAPIALAFRLLGAGVWQGRLPSVLFTLGSLALLWRLAQRLYSRRTAWAALALVLLLPFNDKLSPILMGRQALGEMPAIFWVLGGFALYLKALERRDLSSTAAGLGAAAAWGVALLTKAQIPPALMISVLAGVLASLWLKRWRLATWCAMIAAGAGLARWGLIELQAMLLAGRSVSAPPLEGYLGMSAVVPVLHVRVTAWIAALAFGLGLALSLLAAAWAWFKELRQNDQLQSSTAEQANWVTRAAILAFLFSWYGWYLLLAMYWPRYLFPALYFGAIFEAELLRQWTNDFDLPRTVRAAASVINRQSGSVGWRGLASLLLIVYKMTIFLLVAAITLPALSNHDVYQAAAFLNARAQNEIRVESYEAQLNFLLEMPVRYPPDTLHVALNKRTLIDPSIQVDYSPDWSTIDYLVVGPSAKDWRLYDPALASGKFRWLVSFGNYDLYEQIR